MLITRASTTIKLLQTIKDQQSAPKNISLLEKLKEVWVISYHHTKNKMKEKKGEKKKKSCMMRSIGREKILV